MKRAGKTDPSKSRRLTDLFLNARSGEPRLFALFEEELEDQLRRQLLSCTATSALGSNPSDVADVIQDTFLRLWRHRDRFDPERGELGAWAWVIARNAAVGVLRKRSRWHPPAVNLNTVVDAGTVEPHVLLVAEEERQVLANALKGVTNPRERQVLELRLVHGLPYADVLRITGVRPGTMATWLHRLCNTLQADAQRAA